MESKELNRLRMIDTSFPLSNPCIGEVGETLMNCWGRKSRQTG